jgi:microcystin-dependent protein
MNPYLGMVFIFGGNFAISGFAICQGQLLAISQNTALFSILGTTYGGDGQSTFALPDLQGKVPIGVGSSFVEGQQGGAVTATLVSSNIPAHTHTLAVNSAAGTTSSPLPTGTTYLAAGPSTGSGPNASSLKTYTTANPNTNLGPLSIQPFGSGQPFSIMQPYLCINYEIALQGIFPSRN